MTALLFPGQGAQRRGLLRELARSAQGVEVLARASATLDYDVGAQDTLGLADPTDVVQLVLFLCGIASANMLAQANVRIDAAAGHSAGAFAAAVVTQALTFEDGLRLVALRGATMRAAFPTGYGMAAILGLDEAAVRGVVERSASGDPLFVTNVNASDNIAISGGRAALERAMVAARRAGARSAKRLEVEVPSHSPLLAQTRTVLARALEAIPLRAPRCVFVGGLEGRALRSADDVRRELAAGVAAPVRWADATRVLYERGVRLFVEASPGDALARLAAAAFPDARAVALDIVGASSIAALAAL